MKFVTTIKGPPKTYKTAMLIAVANIEAERGRRVRYHTAEETHESLHGRGLDVRVGVLPLDANSKDRQGKVVSILENGDRLVWRARQARRKS